MKMNYTTKITEDAADQISGRIQGYDWRFDAIIKAACDKAEALGMNKVLNGLGKLCPHCNGELARPNLDAADAEEKKNAI